MIDWDKVPLKIQTAYTWKGPLYGFEKATIVSLGVPSFKGKSGRLILLDDPEAGCVVRKVKTSADRFISWSGEDAFEKARDYFAHHRFMDTNYNHMNVNYFESVWRRYIRMKNG